MIYINVDSPNLGFPYFNFLGVTQWRKNPVPGEENVDPGVGGDDDDEGQEEDLAVVQRVVDVRPVVWAVLIITNYWREVNSFQDGFPRQCGITLIADIPSYERSY